VRGDASSLPSDAGAFAGLLKVIARIDSRPKVALLVLALVCVGPLVLTVQFFSDIHAGLTELLPKTAPSVRGLDVLQQRLGAQARLIVIAQSPHADANRRFITELGARLEKRRVPEARNIQVGIHEEGKWVRDHAPLLMPQAKFESVMTKLEDAVKRAKLAANPLYVDVGGEDNATAWKKLDDELEEEARKNDRFPNGYFELPDGSRVIAMISLNGDQTDLAPSDNLLRAVKEEAAAIRGNYPADLAVG
jgi:hypothetical protein